jgi:hypothetical protein
VVVAAGIAGQEGTSAPRDEDVLEALKAQALAAGHRVGEDHPSCLRLPGGHGQADDGTTRKECGPKHRAAHETRTIPIPPEFASLLRADVKR